MLQLLNKQSRKFQLHENRVLIKIECSFAILKFVIGLTSGAIVL